MPYPTNESTPPAVQARHKGHCLTVWRTVWNETFDRHGDEGRAFATAETAAQQCEASKMTSLMAVKFVDGSDSMIEGLAIPFGGPLGGKDLHGEDFGPDTDFAFDMYPHGRPVIYDHGTDGSLKVTVQGQQLQHEIIDEGVWAQVQLNKSAKYHATVARLIAAGKMFFSSGTAPQMVEVDGTGHIKQWPWMELSLTTHPANPDAVVHAVKAVDHIQHLTEAGLDVPADLIAQAIKALDGPNTDAIGGSESEPFAVHAERVSALVDAFAQRVESRDEARTKSGRSLSAANRAEVAEVIASIDHLRVLRDSLAELIVRTDPATVDAAKVAEARAIEAEYLRLQSKILGVPMPA